jgi:hypothetical protein
LWDAFKEERVPVLVKSGMKLRDANRIAAKEWMAMDVAQRKKASGVKGVYDVDDANADDKGDETYRSCAIVQDVRVAPEPAPPRNVSSSQFSLNELRFEWRGWCCSVLLLTGCNVVNLRSAFMGII